MGRIKHASDVARRRSRELQWAESNPLLGIVLREDHWWQGEGIAAVTEAQVEVRLR